MAEREGRADPRLVEWGLRLRRYREARGLSIDELAHAAGVSARQLIRVEHGRASLSVLWILDIAETLEIKPAELFQD